MTRGPLLLIAAAAAVLAGCGGGGSGTETASRPFQPEASLNAVGGTARTDKPSFVLRVLTRPGDTNIRSVAVKLPKVVLVDTTAIGSICSRSQLAANGCAGRSRLGSARAISPSYGRPLSGPVYPVSGGSRLPKLVFLLGGPADLQLEGRIVSEGGRMEAGVEDVPNAPLDSFEFTIDGGRSGYLVLSRDICRSATVADGTFESQDGEVVEQKIPLRATCG